MNCTELDAWDQVILYILFYVDFLLNAIIHFSISSTICCFRQELNSGTQFFLSDGNLSCD